MMKLLNSETKIMILYKKKKKKILYLMPHGIGGIKNKLHRHLFIKFVSNIIRGCYTHTTGKDCPRQ